MREDVPRDREVERPEHDRREQHQLRPDSDAASRERTAAATLRFARDGRAIDPRHRRARRAGDAALRLPAPRARPRADRGPPRRRPGAPLRRGEDGAARPARPRLVEGGGGRPRVARRGPAGSRSRARRPRTTRCRRGRELHGRVGPRHRRLARDRAGDRAALRARRRDARRDRLPPQRRAPPRRPPRSCARSAPSRCSCAATSPPTRVPTRSPALGPLDALVHNAATGVIRPALETEDKHWDWTLAANARALLSLARAAAPQMPAGSSIVGISSLGVAARARELRPRRHVEGGARVARPLPRGRARAARDPRQRGLRRRRRDRRARPLPEPRGDARAARRAHAGRPAGRARGHRRRGRVPLLARGGDDPRPDADRRRRLLAPRRDHSMEPAATTTVARSTSASHVAGRARDAGDPASDPRATSRRRRRPRPRTSLRHGRGSIELAAARTRSSPGSTTTSRRSRLRDAGSSPIHWVLAVDVHALPPSSCSAAGTSSTSAHGSLYAAPRRRPSGRAASPRRSVAGGVAPRPRSASVRPRASSVRPLAWRLLRRRRASPTSSTPSSARASSCAASRSGRARTARPVPPRAGRRAPRRLGRPKQPSRARVARHPHRPERRSAVNAPSLPGNESTTRPVAGSTPEDPVDLLVRHPVVPSRCSRGLDERSTDASCRRGSRRRVEARRSCHRRSRPRSHSPSPGSETAPSPRLRRSSPPRCRVDARESVASRPKPTQSEPPRRASPSDIAPTVMRRTTRAGGIDFGEHAERHRASVQTRAAQRRSRRTAIHRMRRTRRRVQRRARRVCSSYPHRAESGGHLAHAAARPDRRVTRFVPGSMRASVPLPSFADPHAPAPRRHRTGAQPVAIRATGAAQRGRVQPRAAA